MDNHALTPSQEGETRRRRIRDEVRGSCVATLRRVFFVIFHLRHGLLMAQLCLNPVSKLNGCPSQSQTFEIFPFQMSRNTCRWRRLSRSATKKRLHRASEAGSGLCRWPRQHRQEQFVFFFDNGFLFLPVLFGFFHQTAQVEDAKTIASPCSDCGPAEPLTKGVLLLDRCHSCRADAKRAPAGLPRHGNQNAQAKRVEQGFSTLRLVSCNHALANRSSSGIASSLRMHQSSGLHLDSFLDHFLKSSWTSKNPGMLSCFWSFGQPCLHECLDTSTREGKRRCWVGNEVVKILGICNGKFIIGLTLARPLILLDYMFMSLFFTQAIFSSTVVITYLNL